VVEVRRRLYNKLDMTGVTSKRPNED
jgi:hypothetical protein